MDEVNKGIPYIALSLQIHREIEVIILTLMVSINHLKKLHLLELIGYISDHDSRSFFIFTHNLKEINVISLSVIAFLFLFGSFSLEF